MKRFLSKIFLILLCPVVVFSQPAIEVFTGLYYPTTTPRELGNNYLEKYFKPSISTGVRTSFQLTNWMNLTPSFSYNYYFYHSYYQEIYQEEYFVASSGEGSHVLRTMIAAQLIDQYGSYIEVGGGYIIERIGSIHGTWQNLGRVEYSVDTQDSTNKYFAYSVGLGVIVNLSTDINVDLSAKYYFNTTDRFYYLFGCSLVYNLSN